MKRLLLACAAALAISGAATVPAMAKAATPYPIEYWAAPEFMSNVEVSPDGMYVAFVKAESQKGDNIIEIYETGNMGKKPVRVGAKSMEIQGFNWVGDREMTVSFNKRVSKRIKGFNQGAFKGKLALYSLEDNSFRELSGDDFFLQQVNALVDEPDHILVEHGEINRNRSTGVPSYYRYNLRNGQKSMVLRGGSDVRGVRFDHEGNPRFASRYDSGSEDFVSLYRPVGGSGWTEYHRLSRDSFETFRYAGMVEGDDDRIYVIAHNGGDREALWKYNLKTKSFEEKVFSHPEVNVATTVRHSNPYQHPGKVTGVIYGTDKYHYNFFDAEEKAVMEQFRNAIPNAHRVQITSRSRDGNTLVVRNVGPKDPGTFYLFRNGKFSQLGSVNGLLKGKDLADVEYIKWTARDGKTVRGYLTKPKGPGPHPLVVMPHGGPFVTEVVEWDDWGQMLANNGYMVLQPQYRGSTNYGLDFYKAAFTEKGEGGYKMQDDKDDGVKHLIEQGLVDKDKVAMFGWSYGGYAALVAASRSPNLYQCVVSGAPVADNFQQVNYYRNRLRGAQKEEQLKFWTESINPIDEVEKVNVPMLLIHGDIDQRVPVRHATKYVDAMKKAGKDIEYIELEGADHFSNTLKYDHKMKAYPRMIEFLEKDCGLG